MNETLLSSACLKKNVTLSKSPVAAEQGGGAIEKFRYKGKNS
jgi:hypothetical protein